MKQITFILITLLITSNSCVSPEEKAEIKVTETYGPGDIQLKAFDERESLTTTSRIDQDVTSKYNGGCENVFNSFFQNGIVQEQLIDSLIESYDYTIETMNDRIEKVRNIHEEDASIDLIKKYVDSEMLLVQLFGEFKSILIVIKTTPDSAKIQFKKCIPLATEYKNSSIEFQNAEVNFMKKYNIQYKE